MGTLVISAPTIPLAHPAMIEFERACTLFQTTGQSSVQPDNSVVCRCSITSMLIILSPAVSQPVLLDLLETAKKARDQGYPLNATPESVVIDDIASRSSQSPVSISSQQSYKSTSSSSGRSQMPIMNEDHRHDKHVVGDHLHKVDTVIPRDDLQWWPPPQKY